MVQMLCKAQNGVDEETSEGPVAVRYTNQISVLKRSFESVSGEEIVEEITMRARGADCCNQSGEQKMAWTGNRV